MIYDFPSLPISESILWSLRRERAVTREALVYQDETATKGKRKSTGAIMALLEDGNFGISSSR